jgi:hypothetical protein
MSLPEPEFSKSYVIALRPICGVCGEPIKQHSVSSTGDVGGSCGCGDVWMGRGIFPAGSAQITKWYRVENPIPLPKPAPKSTMLWGDLGLFIEDVEEAIRDDVRNHGRVPQLPQNRERVGDSADRLASKLVTMANSLAVELGMSGDPNITFMHCLSMISYAWTTFILEAKSKAEQRYPPEGLKYMKFLVDSNPDLFRKIHEQAVAYGDDYPVDNPKWAEAVAEWEEKQRVKVPPILEAQKDTEFGRADAVRRQREAEEEVKKEPDFHGRKCPLIENVCTAMEESTYKRCVEGIAKGEAPWCDIKDPKNREGAAITQSGLGD